MKKQKRYQQKSLTWEEWAGVNLSEWLVEVLAATVGLTLMPWNAGQVMVHGGGKGDAQGFESDSWGWRELSRGRRSWQIEKNYGVTKEETYIERKLCPLDIFSQSQSWPPCTVDIPAAAAAKSLSRVWLSVTP